MTGREWQGGRTDRDRPRGSHFHVSLTSRAVYGGDVRDVSQMAKLPTCGQGQLGGRLPRFRTGVYGQGGRGGDKTWTRVGPQPPPPILLCGGCQRPNRHICPRTLQGSVSHEQGIYLRTTSDEIRGSRAPTSLQNSDEREGRRSGHA